MLDNFQLLISSETEMLCSRERGRTDRLRERVRNEFKPAGRGDLSVVFSNAKMRTTNRSSRQDILRRKRERERVQNPPVNQQDPTPAPSAEKYARFNPLLRAAAS